MFAWNEWEKISTWKTLLYPLASTMANPSCNRLSQIVFHLLYYNKQSNYNSDVDTDGINMHTPHQYVIEIGLYFACPNIQENIFKMIYYSLKILGLNCRSDQQSN
jgi:hypothetical protein